MKKYMKNKSNKEIIHAIAKEMDCEFIENSDSNELSSRMLNISKPGRPEVKEFLQRQLEMIVGLRIKAEKENVKT